MIHLDTHVVVWLYAGRSEQIPAAARAVLEAEELAISPMVVLELQYLFETGRVSEPAAPVVRELGSKLGLEVSSVPFADVVARAAALSWTRDPFDRLIAAQALVEGVPLLTADKTLRRRLPNTVWTRPVARRSPATTTRGSPRGP